MPVLSGQQGHVLAPLSTTSGDDSAKIGAGIGDDVIDLPGSVPFSCDVFQPVALAAMVANRIPAGGGEGLIPTCLDNVRTCRVGDRRGDDIPGQIFDGGRTRVVRQTKDLGRVGFQPLLDAFRREAWKLPEASVIFRQFGKDLGPTLRKRTFVDDKATGIQCGESLNAAALVWSNAPVIVGAHDTGPLIRSRNGFWLAIPTPATGKSTRGGRITPANGSVARGCGCASFTAAGARACSWPRGG